MYRIIEVPEEAAESTEQLGSKPKFWFADASGQRFLFKQGRSGTGENWAEKVSAEICALLQIPHASYELAVWRGIQGVVSASFVAAGSRLIFGNELLARVVSGYEAETRYYRQSGHTVLRVFAVLRDPGLQPPAAWQKARYINTASDVFVGYLMLDALIGNTDRHHENWGLVLRSRPEGQDLQLAPTFDHASSLGRNESLARIQPIRSAGTRKERDQRSIGRRPTHGLSPRSRPLRKLPSFVRVPRKIGSAGLERCTTLIFDQS